MPTAGGALLEEEPSAAWHEMAEGALLSGALEDAAPPGADRHLVLFLELPFVPAGLAGRRLRLALGETGLLATTLRASEAPVEFGPLRLTLAEAGRLSGEPARLRLGDGPPLPPGRLAGLPLEAMALDGEDAFFAKVQLNHSRYADPVLLRLGALAGYRRLAGFAPRAAALTILAHRVLERDLRQLTAQDHEEAAWLRRAGRALVEEGVAELAAARAPHWTMVRWTTSLATVCGMLSLCQDDAAEASFFLGAAAAQSHLVQLAPVAAMNMVNACLLHGLLLALAGEREAAAGVLERGVRAFQPCVAAQDVMANVWVIGDMINVGRASRQCFVALCRLGLMEPGRVPRIREDTRLDLTQVASPFARILKAGLCPGVAAGLAALEPSAS